MARPRLVHAAMPPWNGATRGEEESPANSNCNMARADSVMSAQHVSRHPANFNAAARGAQ
jgi:hypothetical protein